MRILFDIGANKGQYADANAAKYDKVILVEANPALCQHLRTKYSKQNTKFCVENVLVSNHQKVPFYVSSTADTISTASVRWITQSRFTGKQKWHSQALTIPCISLDQLIVKHGRPTYIKIDVEGYEYNVLQSLTVPVTPPIPLAFEWAEECFEDILLSLTYLAEKLNYQTFALQMEDAYHIEPAAHTYMSHAQLTRLLQQQLRPARKQLWGMIHCR